LDKTLPASQSDSDLSAELSEDSSDTQAKLVLAVLAEIEETLADALSNLESGYFSLAITALDKILTTTRTAIKAGESINR
jgi:hypothetical protein